MNKILNTLGIPITSSPPPLKWVGFEDIKNNITPLNSKLNKIYLINTLPITNQQCLIPNTVPAAEEETLINSLMDNEPMGSLQIIIYGKHSADFTTETKYKQMVQLGFSKVFIYAGGLFEWLLLQDIYGYDEFPTTTRVADILKYRPKPVLL